MFNLLVSRAVILALLMSPFGLGLPSRTQAEIIGIQTLLDAQKRVDRVNRIEKMLSQDNIRARLIAWGVDPEQAKKRVAALTDSELQRLENQLDTLPAGGDALAIIGAVFLVLLILELVGVTNIFTRL